MGHLAGAEVYSSRVSLTRQLKKGAALEHTSIRIRAMKIGFIGLGTMGRHMASNLIKAGHELVVHDVRPEASAPHRKAGAGWAETPREVAEATHVVFTSLPGPPEVEAVALGEQGLLAGLAAVKVYFDLTTNSPALVRRIHAVFAARGIQMLDAPVSGGPRGAETRRLALWVGGDETVFERYKPVLEAIGDQFLPGRFEPAAFALRLAHKDVTLATSLGREHKVPMRLATITLEEMTEALNRGWGERDSRVAMLLQEERAGVEIRVPDAAIRQVLDLDKG